MGQISVIISRNPGSAFSANQQAREHADRDEVKFVSRMIYGKKTVQFWELYDDGAMGNWSRKAAVWRLIDLRVLVPMNDAERINDLSRLTINL